MKIRIAALALSIAFLVTLISVRTATASGPNFAAGIDSWRVVLDGVMGGRSSGRVTASGSGNLVFDGDLSMENNGGFSQIRTAIDRGLFEGADGVEIRVRGDGRSYNFDLRVSNARMMAGAFQQEFRTLAGQWLTIQLPFDQFRLYSFGRRVPNAVTLNPARIESLGLTLSDKIESEFRIEISDIRPYGASDAPPSAGGNDLASVAGSAGLNTLLQLIRAADLELPEGQPLTILAPTDAAFANVPAETLEAALRPENRELLRSVLKHHVLTPALTSKQLLSRRTLDTLNGQRLRVDDLGAPMINGAGLVAVDVRFDGGIVHVIDQVLLPELGSIADIGPDIEELSTLTTAVIAAGLGDQLSAENGPWTIFAPVDSAFANLPQGTVESLLEPQNIGQLTDILGLHLVPGRLYASDLLAAKSAQTLFGQTIDFGLENGRLRVGDASLIGSEIEASNGVIHLIDAVLLPAPAEARTTEFDAEAARLIELAINRGAPLFNAGQTGACASVYELTIESLVALGSGKLDRNSIQRLEMGLAEAETQRSAADRAWTFRRAMDDVYTRLAQPAGPSRSAVSH